MTEYPDFQEVAHCGGRATFHFVCEPDGRRTFALGFQHDRPTPASWVGIYALAHHAIPVADFRIGGMGQGFDPQPLEGSLPVFLASDSRQCWGHQCPACGGYFRNGTHPAIYPLTCPYCGKRAGAFEFLTPAQRAYVRHYLATLQGGFEAEMEPGTQFDLIIDMDAIADKGTDLPKPDFYYSAPGQQTRYNCEHCGEFNDIRGRFGYCVSCGWRNNLASLKASSEILRERLNAQQVSPQEAVRSCVSEFDGCCRDFAVQLAGRIPMKAGRKAELERLVFHDFGSTTVAAMKAMFDIDLSNGLSDDVPFLNMMMHRRHVFEHNGGVADRRYVAESGDPDAQDGVLLRETQENAHRLIGCLRRMVKNFDRDFHAIFPPTSWPINYFRDQQARKGPR